MNESEEPLLEIENLTVERSLPMGEKAIGLRNISLKLMPGEVVILAGEAGSGKSLFTRVIAGDPGGRTKILNGTVRFEGKDLLRAKQKQKRRHRSRAIAMINRHPQDQFNPDRTVHQWLRDAARLAYGPVDKERPKDWSELFYSVGIIEPERILPRRMCDLPALLLQRLMLMKALISKSSLIVCDEATTDMDRIAANTFLEVLLQVQKEYGVTLLMTTGNLTGMSEVADRVAILFDGAILESGPVDDVFARPSFEYTREFLGCSPKITHYPRELPTISREAIAEAEEAIHSGESIELGGATG